MITGASSGIGLAIARVLGEEGYALRLRGEAEPVAVSRRQLAELRKRLVSH